MLSNAHLTFYFCYLQFNLTFKNNKNLNKNTFLDGNVSRQYIPTYIFSADPDIVEITVKVCMR